MVVYVTGAKAESSFVSRVEICNDGRASQRILIFALYTPFKLLFLNAWEKLHMIPDGLVFHIDITGQYYQAKQLETKPIQFNSNEYIILVFVCNCPRY